MVLRAVVQVAAFVFLVQFGLRLLGLPPDVAGARLTGLSIARRRASSCGVPPWPPPSRAGASPSGRQAVDGLARYALLLPGRRCCRRSGLWRQRAELGDAGMTGIKPYAARRRGGARRLRGARRADRRARARSRRAGSATPTAGST